MRKLAVALFLLAAAAWSVPADAFTLYFAGGEDTSLNAVGTTGAFSSSGANRSSFSRGAMSINNATTTSDPPANRWQTPTISSVSTLWIHGQLWTAGTGSTLNQQSLLVRSPDGVSRLLLRQTATFGQFKASTRNAVGTITDLATASGNLISNTVTSVDIKIVYGCTSSDVFQVYLAGVSVINYTGASICTDAATTLNQVEFMGVSNSGQASNIACTAGPGTGTCWSEVVLADADTRGMGLWTLAPQASGNTQSWTPNTVADVNPTTINDANFVSTGSANALSEWTTPTSPPSGTWNVIAIVQEARVLASTTGPSTAEWLIRTKDGTDHVTGSFTPPVASFANFNNQIWTTNPHTAASWVITDIATGFNLGIESTP